MDLFKSTATDYVEASDDDLTGLIVLVTGAQANVVETDQTQEVFLTQENFTSSEVRTHILVYRSSTIVTAPSMLPSIYLSTSPGADPTSMSISGPDLAPPNDADETDTPTETTELLSYTPSASSSTSPSASLSSPP